MLEDLKTLAVQLRAGRDLDREAIARAAAALCEPGDEAADEAKTDFLRALADKGETAAEVAGFAEAFRTRALDPGVGEFSAQAIDIVGTGGDHAGAFNISSLVVLTLACAGLPVMKHGNRGITSKCGSADLLAGLGYDLTASPEKLRVGLRELGYAFFFAPAYHPAFKHVAPARKKLAAEGRRSVFNVLGPLLNPGRPAHLLLGVFAEPWAARLADAVHRLGGLSGIAVHGRLGDGRGVDELTSATDTRVRGFGRNRALDAVWTPEALGLRRADFTDLTGGDLAQNLAIADALMNGHGPAGLADTIALNASVALWIAGRIDSPADAVGEMRALLTGGAVKARVAATREFFACA